jgi:hypothetical protein
MTYQRRRVPSQSCRQSTQAPFLALLAQTELSVSVNLASYLSDRYQQRYLRVAKC